eukprot:Pgem_evm1s14367
MAKVITGFSKFHMVVNRSTRKETVNGKAYDIDVFQFLTDEHYGPKAYDIEIEYAYCPCAMGKYGKCSHVGDGNKEARAIPNKEWDMVKPKTLHNEMHEGEKRRRSSLSVQQ